MSGTVNRDEVRAAAILLRCEEGHTDLAHLPHEYGTAIITVCDFALEQLDQPEPDGIPCPNCGRYFVREGPAPDDRVERERLAAALEQLASCRVFVTSRERIKRPEGEELWDECIATLRAGLSPPPEPTR